jgi:hypothetical protein
VMLPLPKCLHRAKQATCDLGSFRRYIDSDARCPVLMHHSVYHPPRTPTHPIKPSSLRLYDMKPITLASIPVTITTLLTSTNAQTGNETLYGLSTVSGTYAIPDLTYDPPEHYEELAVAGMNAALDPSQYGEMRPGSNELRAMHKQHIFVPFTNQEGAASRLKSAVGYFHNSDEYDLNGIRKCYVIPALPVIGSGVRTSQYVIVCEMVPLGSQSRTGPLTYAGALGTKARTLEELKEHFMGEGSLWRLAPIPRFLDKPNRRDIY